MEQSVIPDYGTDTSRGTESADESGDDGGWGEEGGGSCEWMGRILIL